MKIHQLYPYLCVHSVDSALAFYRAAFGATEHFRLTEPDGRVGHAEMYLGEHVVMLAEEYPELGFHAPSADAPPAFSLHLHVEDADALMKSAVAAGATVEREAEDQFYGERSGTVVDPFGYRWMIGHSVEDVSVEEMQKRYRQMFTGATAS